MNVLGKVNLVGIATTTVLEAKDLADLGRKLQRLRTEYPNRWPTSARLCTWPGDRSRGPFFSLELVMTYHDRPEPLRFDYRVFETVVPGISVGGVELWRDCAGSGDARLILDVSVTGAPDDGSNCPCYYVGVLTSDEPLDSVKDLLIKVGRWRSELAGSPVT